MAIFVRIFSANHIFPMMNRQSTRQKQVQKQTLKHKTKPQLVLEARLLEMPQDMLMERIDEEMMVNPYLTKTESGEEYAGDDADESGMAGNTESEHPDRGESHDESERQDDGESDELPVANNGYYDGPERQTSEQETLREHLLAQLQDYTLGEREQMLVEYLIGSVDSDGLIDATLHQLCDDLYITYNMDVSEAELGAALRILQQFEPAGIGAHSVRESLWLQAQRMKSERKRKLFSILFAEEHYEDFLRQRWERIRQECGLTEADISYMRTNLRYFIPHPGRGYGGEQHDEIVRPDFEVNIEDGRLELQLNDRDMADVSIDMDDLEEHICRARERRDTATERLYRSYAESGRNFMEALRQRRATMVGTMQAIIQWQRPFFVEGDPDLIRPMTLEDVASQTGQDISTVSRVCRNKYVHTPYGTFPLKWFFNAKARTEDKDVTTIQVKNALKELIDNEPKDKPLSDQRLTEELNRMGFLVARRTVAKYRDQMNVLGASKRKR